VDSNYGRENARDPALAAADSKFVPAAAPDRVQVVAVNNCGQAKAPDLVQVVAVNKSAREKVLGLAPEVAASRSAPVTIRVHLGRAKVGVANRSDLVTMVDPGGLATTTDRSGPATTRAPRGPARTAVAGSGDPAIITARTACPIMTAGRIGGTTIGRTSTTIGPITEIITVTGSTAIGVITIRIGTGDPGSTTGPGRPGRL
jgi:hypothetical protein